MKNGSETKKQQELLQKKYERKNDISKCIVTPQPMESSSPKSKKIICEYCNREFTRNYGLKKHQNGRCKSMSKEADYERLLKENKNLKIKCCKLEETVEFLIKQIN